MLKGGKFVANKSDPLLPTLEAAAERHPIVSSPDKGGSGPYVTTINYTTPRPSSKEHGNSTNMSDDVHEEDVPIIVYCSMKNMDVAVICPDVAVKCPDIPRSDEKLECSDTNVDNVPDGGWGWVVVASTFILGVILDGIAMSFGVFFVHMLSYFRSSKSTTSWIGSVMTGTYLSVGPVASMLVMAFGSRRVTMAGAALTSVALFLSTWSPNVVVMIITFGLLGGFGIGLMFLPPILTVNHYFSKKRSLAMGIAVCGSGVGSFVFPTLSEFLTARYTWKGALWIISAIAMNGIVMGLLLRPLKRIRKDGSIANDRDNGKMIGDNDRKCCDVSKLFDFSILKSPSLLLYGGSCFLNTLGFFIPVTYIPDLAIGFGVEPQQSAMLISIIGITNTIFRVVVGWVAGSEWADTILVNNVFLMAGGVATMFVPLYSAYPAMAAYCAFYGLTLAVYITLNALIPTELFGVEGADSSLGLVKMCQGIASFVGTPIAGALSDMSGNYQNSFYMAGATIALSGLICLPLRRISRWERRHVLQKQISQALPNAT